jgi:4-amino-4-deoxy-L-arabinose transferase-like glycosyltransferase
LIIIGASLLFFPFLGSVHLFDWDEINFAECAREMIVSKDYLRTQIDFLPFWEKPPFFIWMQVVAMKLFGVGEFAARFPNAAIGVATLVSLFYAGNRVYNNKVGLLWVITYATTWLPSFYFKTGIIDPVFNFFIFIALFQFYLLTQNDKRYLHAVLCGTFFGIAVLTKGPVAVLVGGLTVLAYLIVSRSFKAVAWQFYFVTAVSCALPMAIWLAVAVWRYGPAYGNWFVNEFVSYQVRLFSTEDSDHGGPFYYHFLVLLFGCFPSSVLLFNFLNRKKDVATASVAFTKLMWILFWVVLVLFSVVKTKIIHYSSLCYYPITLLAALQVYWVADGVKKQQPFIVPLLLILGALLGIAIGAIPLVGLYKDSIVPLIKDPFVVGCWNAEVTWSIWECVPGAVYLCSLVYFAINAKRSFFKSFLVLSAVQISVISFVLQHFAPKIETITQGAAIDYYQSLKGKDVYIHPLGYKSYAYLFYGATVFTQACKADTGANHAAFFANEDRLLNGIIDKPVYFIAKIQDAGKYNAMAQMKEIGRKDGFVFFRRDLLTKSN